MSDNIVHLSVRARLSELTGKSCNDVFPFFREKFGEPTDFYSEESWYYSRDEDTIVPIHDYEKKEWGIEYILVHCLDYESSPISISFSRFQELAEKLKSICPTIEEPMVSSYTWYNGVDEPISFEVNNGNSKP